MHPSAESFVARARETYGFDPDVVECSDSTKTAKDAADAVGCSVGQIASSLVFDVNDALVVAVTSGANRVDERSLGESAGRTRADVSMADPGRIKRTVGWSIGGVPPFCHDRSIPVFLDETLLAYDTVWAAAGTPNAVFPIDPERLHRFADAEVVDIAEEPT